VIKYGDGTDLDVEDCLSFPPIPPPTPVNHQPQILINTETLKLHHLQDRLFKRPMGEVRIKCMISEKFMR